MHSPYVTFKGELMEYLKFKYHNMKLNFYFYFSENTKNIPLSPWLRERMLLMALKSLTIIGKYHFNHTLP